MGNPSVEIASSLCSLDANLTPRNERTGLLIASGAKQSTRHAFESPGAEVLARRGVTAGLGSKSRHSALGRHPAAPENRSGD